MSLKLEVPVVLIPAIDDVTVTTPADIGVTSKPAEKSIVAAAPTATPLSLTSIPDPTAVTPVSAEPSRAGSAPVSCPAGNPVSPAPDPE